MTLFTPSTHEANVTPNVLIKGKKIALEKTPRVLGVILDTMHTFSHHVKSTIDKGKRKVSLLKSLAGTNWGQDQETLLITYKSTCKSTLEYGSHIWSPAISESNWNKLQLVQNQALRISTGCHMMSDIDHLHQESKILPIKEHCKMTAQQYLASCHVPDHPGFKHIDKPNPPRMMKKSILNYLEETREFLLPDEHSEITNKQTLKNIHTHSVEKCIESYKHNKVLNAPAPEVNPEITKLHRNTRTALSQLRSGYSKLLNSYMSRIDDTIPDECPLCKQSSHTTTHLFNCQANPTNLDVISLWTNPIEAAKFLNDVDDPP